MVATTFSKNRDRLLESDVPGAFFDAVRRQADDTGLLSDEHFTVDGTLLDAWAKPGRSACRAGARGVVRPRRSLRLVTPTSPAGTQAGQVVGRRGEGDNPIDGPPPYERSRLGAG